MASSPLFSLFMPPKPNPKKNHTHTVLVKMMIQMKCMTGGDSKQNSMKPKLAKNKPTKKKGGKVAWNFTPKKKRGSTKRKEDGR